MKWIAMASPRSWRSLQYFLFATSQTNYIARMTKIDLKLEHSDFSGEFTEDDVVVHIDIYRAAGSESGWTLEVVDETGASTVWDDTFPTDRAAYEEFLATVQRDGIESFSDEPTTYLH